ncbi:MAG TPA: ABC transporter permease [Thermoleophilia bacterium]|nr:ABC transporter permease [Thermoleophilia bacterium]
MTSGAGGDPRDLPLYDTAAPRSRVLDELRDLYRYRDLLLNLILRSITARYKRSVLGILWTLLDPLLTMAVMAVIFSALFAQSQRAYPVYLLSALVIWNFFSQSTTQAMGDLVYGGSLMGKVYMPRSVFAVAAVGAGLVNVIVSLLPLFLLMLIFRTPLTATLLFLPIALATVALFSLGFSLLMSTFAVYFADVMNIHRILLRLLMYLSGVFYTLDVLPNWLKPIVNVNPLYHLISLFRAPIYNGVMPESVSLFVALGATSAMLLVGYSAYMRVSDDFAYRL